MDITKAFEELDHKILFRKLSNFGFSHNFNCYLPNRKRYVTYRGYKSIECQVTSGVLQGSIFGLILFNIFVNGIGVDCLLYADDLKLYSPE